MVDDEDRGDGKVSRARSRSNGTWHVYTACVLNCMHASPACTHYEGGKSFSTWDDAMNWRVVRLPSDGNKNIDSINLPFSHALSA